MTWELITLFLDDRVPVSHLLVNFYNHQLFKKKRKNSEKKQGKSQKLSGALLKAKVKDLKEKKKKQN